jgi:hypothetical protein
MNVHAYPTIFHVLEEAVEKNYNFNFISPESS